MFNKTLNKIKQIGKTMQEQHQSKLNSIENTLPSLHDFLTEAYKVDNLKAHVEAILDKEVNVLKEINDEIYNIINVTGYKTESTLRDQIIPIHDELKDKPVLENFLHSDMVWAKTAMPHFSDAIFPQNLHTLLRLHDAVRINNMIKNLIDNGVDQLTVEELEERIPDLSHEPFKNSTLTQIKEDICKLYNALTVEQKQHWARLEENHEASVEENHEVPVQEPTLAEIQEKVLNTIGEQVLNGLGNTKEDFENKIKEDVKKIYNRYQGDEYGFIDAVCRYTVKIIAYLGALKDKLFGTEEQKAKSIGTLATERYEASVEGKFDKISTSWTDKLKAETKKLENQQQQNGID